MPVPTTTPTILPAVALALALTGAAPALADIIYVSTCGSDAWTGTGSFCEAPDGPKRTIQAAIGRASDGDEIRVTAGTYTGLVNFNGLGVRVLGLTGAELTTIDGNGSGPVVQCVNGEGPDSILEGFTITGGDTNGSGGGMLCFGTSPTIRECVFDGNVAGDAGGGLACFGGSPSIADSRFDYNEAMLGGGMSAQLGATPDISNTYFRWNSADQADGSGGGLFNEASSPTISDSAFVGNEALTGGGAMTSLDGAAPVVHSTEFRDNTGIIGSGGAVKGKNSSSSFFDCQFTDNLSDLEGGAVFNSDGEATFHDCQFTNNRASSGGAVLGVRSPIEFLRCTFVENHANGPGIGGVGGVMKATHGHTIFRECEFEQNIANRYGGAIAARMGSEFEVFDSAFRQNIAEDTGGAISLTETGAWVEITDSEFWNNETSEATQPGGGAIGQTHGTLLVSTSEFVGNDSANDGGAIMTSESTATVVNSLFVFNTAGTGGAIAAVETGTVRIVGSLFRDNTANGGGAIFDQAGHDTWVVNCTAVANTANVGAGLLANGMTEVSNSVFWGNGNLGVFGFGSPQIRYSLIDGGWPGTGNLDLDPDFVNPDFDNYRLNATSPAIDAGVNHAVPADATDLDADGNEGERMPRDLDDNPRFMDAAGADIGCGPVAIVDMGAYEVDGAAADDVVIGDIDGDGAVGFADLLQVLNAWGPCEGCCPADLDLNGFVDFDDLLTILAEWDF